MIEDIFFFQWFLATSFGWVDPLFVGIIGVLQEAMVVLVATPVCNESCLLREMDLNDSIADTWRGELLEPPPQ
jgi:hypothetical protein